MTYVEVDVPMPRVKEDDVVNWMLGATIERIIAVDAVIDPDVPVIVSV